MTLKLAVCAAVWLFNQILRWKTKFGSYLVLEWVLEKVCREQSHVIKLKVEQTLKALKSIQANYLTTEEDFGIWLLTFFQHFEKTFFDVHFEILVLVSYLQTSLSMPSTDYIAWHGKHNVGWSLWVYSDTPVACISALESDSLVFKWSCDRSFPPGDGKTDFVSDRQDPLQVLWPEGAGLPEGDPGGKALDDDRVGVVLDPLVRHLDRVLDAQCLPILPVEQILDLLSQRVGQVDPGQLGLQALWRQKTLSSFKGSAAVTRPSSWFSLKSHGDYCWYTMLIDVLKSATSDLRFKVSWRWK